MLQDSVPAGSYNDPFLSSVCVCVQVVCRESCCVVTNCVCVVVTSCVCVRASCV